MRAAATQNLTDGEIFYIIENGIRFTGMPAFGTGKPDPAGEKQVWHSCASSATCHRLRLTRSTG